MANVHAEVGVRSSPETPKEVAIEVNHAAGDEWPTSMTTFSNSDCNIGSGGHRLLRGGRPPYSNDLSAGQMEALAAISDTIIPSLDLGATGYDGDDHSLRTFYATSASMAGTPEHVAGLLSERMKHPLLWLVRLVLWLLSTSIGTLLLCGWLAIGGAFPYVRRFSQIERHKRERILRSWSSSCITLYRPLFHSMKLLTTLTFYTKSNHDNRNPSWEAIGYNGPDPEFSTRKKMMGRGKDDGRFGPLQGCIVDMEHTRLEDTIEFIKKSGFSVEKKNKNDNKTSLSFGGEPDDNVRMTIGCDAVVVGSGSGGGVAAGVIASAGFKVVVLEKGSYYAGDRLSLLEGPTLDQMYEGAGLVASDDLGVLILAGSAVGGGSAINWSASIRTPNHVRTEWSKKNELELFTSQAYTEALDSVCNRMGVQIKADALTSEEESLSNSVLRRGCSELGFPVNNIPRNSPSDHRCGWCCFGCKDGKKKGTHETWLVDAVKSGNGIVISGAKAVKVITKKRKGNRNLSIGVLFEKANRDNGTDRYFIESKVTIVAGGALGTPALLKKSGLRNPAIGRNLHLHPVQMSWGYFPDSDKSSYESGIMTAMSSVAANFDSTGYGAVIQTPALHPGMFSVLMPWLSGLDMKERMKRFSRTAHLFALVRDQGSGTVDFPKSITYSLVKEDQENMKKGLEKVLRILAAAGAEEIGTHHIGGEKINVKRASYNEFETFVKSASARGAQGLTAPLCSAHQMGSCRMGVSPRGSVVNPSGECWEVEGLYLADSSVLPGAVGVNPMVTIMAVAHCTATGVVEVLRRKRKDSSYQSARTKVHV